ncbi:universal stress protein [Phyllobacterium myrsinacearum]|uniref:Nucleotide-binding universal stress UspA family protein n=1 Tax=Phyllobacterium myrsinacearum TaxID=28101 RepID=A0A839EPS0_9HYPH|nr:universal stress protein [Phyllobacterium myrsinacearum]MBA8882081.1 nucleotide-binding universal stress UspA family protein [Phyllobacterium myrsinacearum]
MTYKTILVSLNIDGPSTPTVEFATDLAKRFNAHLIGLSAADVSPLIASPDGMGVNGDVMQLEREDIEFRLKELQRHFETIAGASPGYEWRDAVANPTRLVIEMARAADLIITDTDGGFDLDSSCSINLGNVLLASGRPVLISPRGARHMFSNSALVAWKDTREARRAISDAIPLLCQMDNVVVATVDRQGDSLVEESVTDVVEMLKRHNIRARSEIIRDKRESESLLEFASSIDADLVVSGAYGHSRVRELVFGGVTNSLLGKHEFSRLMAS